MAIVRKATQRDFDGVYSLLSKLILIPSIRKEQWQKLFLNHWRSDEDYVGYLLEEEGCIVGFLGYLFSKRTINGRIEKFCNMTSWAVEEKYRAKSLGLFYPLLHLSKCTLTNFTAASNEVNKILKRLGMQVLDNESVLIYPIPSFRDSKEKTELVYDKSEIEACLIGKDIEIFKDHLSFDCQHVLIRSGANNCYLIMAEVFRRRIPILSIQYISNPDVFKRCVNRILFKLLMRYGKIFLQVDRRLLRGRVIPNSKIIPWGCEKLYRSETVEKEDVDNLYSELFLLGIYT